jgi:serine protein kinase
MNAKAEEILSLISDDQDMEKFRALHWTGTFREYLDLILEDPRIVRNAHQRIYDMIMSFGTEEFTQQKEKLVRYHFFSDPIDGGAEAIFGLERALMRLVGCSSSRGLRHREARAPAPRPGRLVEVHDRAADEEGTGALLGHRRRRALHVRMARRGGRRARPGSLPHARGAAAAGPRRGSRRSRQLPQRGVLGAGRYRPAPSGHSDLCPFCRKVLLGALMLQHDGDWQKVIDHVQVRRIGSSARRTASASARSSPRTRRTRTRPSSPATSTTARSREYGSDSDPRAFNFDGEFNIANRGIIEFIEVLKLDVAFLYDLLGASQEHKIKPKKFAQTDIDEVIIGHTNEPEYKKLQNNELMEAFRDRTIKIDIPYNIRSSTTRSRSTRRTSTPGARPGKHIAPHTLEVAAMWAVLTRLEEPKKANLTLLQKLKLYNGKSLPGFTEDNVKELREEVAARGHGRHLPRYIQDKISNALVSERSPSINPFMVMNELESRARPPLPDHERGGSRSATASCSRS